MPEEHVTPAIDPEHIKLGYIGKVLNPCLDYTIDTKC
jgi:hypothetical protein